MDDASALAASAFGLTAKNAVSLCAYAPVWRIARHGGDVVLKRTGFPRSRAASIAAWTEALNARGVDVVMPDRRFAPNPRKIAGDWPGEWVVYPFVAGNAYTGRTNQLEGAGRLLGRLQAAGADLGRGMVEEPRLPLRSEAWLVNHVARASDAIGKYAPERKTEWAEIADRLPAAHARARARLSARRLPVVACSWDFKASNLVYPAEYRPVLVDPDHAARIPRLYDLACSAVLFHVDHAASPARLFASAEWKSFVTSYRSMVELTQAELDAWPDVLLAAWADQGIWLLGNWPAGWDSPRDRSYLIELMRPDLAQFAL
jgi:spectinomycin phosphotransferase